MEHTSTGTKSTESAKSIDVRVLHPRSVINDRFNHDTNSDVFPLNFPSFRFEWLMLDFLQDIDKKSGQPCTNLKEDCCQLVLKVFRDERILTCNMFSATTKSTNFAFVNVVICIFFYSLKISTSRQHTVLSDECKAEIIMTDYLAPKFNGLI